MITLKYLEGKAYVWNAEDWLTLRKTHRIVGVLVGAIASFPRHDSFQGLPLELLSEETALLIEEGYCKLVECSDLNTEPSESLQELVKETEKRLHAEQWECMKEKRVEQLSSKIDMIIAGKQKKMASQGKSSDCSRDTLVEEELKKMPPLDVAHTLVQIPTEHPWPLESKPVAVSELNPSITSDIGKVRYAAFRDLWKKGHYITAGTKFGGDFLVYPGDPEKFHSIYVVKCAQSEEQEFNILNIVSLGRLGVAVNKLTVYAYLNSANEIAYQTLQWHETLY